jgi:carboxypeptidase D
MKYSFAIITTVLLLGTSDAATNLRKRFVETNEDTPFYAHWHPNFKSRASFSTQAGYKLADGIPGLQTSQSTTTYSSWAGHVNVTNINQLFFWLVSNSDKLSSSRPLVLWLNGGPGCSSMDGMWIENGPYRVNQNGKVDIVEPNWIDYGGVDMLYLDQPAQTGYSFVGKAPTTGGIPSTLSEVANQVVTFLQTFYKLFPEKKQSDFYLAGESFAGTYIPYIASAWIVAGNTVKGVALGNPWTNPVAMYNSYLDFAIAKKMLPADSDAAKKARAQTTQCNKEYGNTAEAKAGEIAPITSSVCDNILTTIIMGTKEYNDGKCLNLYDIRLTDTALCNGMSWPPGIQDMRTYLANSSNAEAFNALRPVKPVWQECANDVYAVVSGDDVSLPAASLLPTLAGQGVEILIYSGDSDFICNYYGAQYLVGNLTWNGETGFINALKQPFITTSKRDTLAGEYVNERNLTNLVIFGASHMVPFDQPLATSQMIAQFVSGGFSAPPVQSTQASTQTSKSTKSTQFTQTTKVATTLLPSAGVSLPSSLHTFLLLITLLL